MTKRRKGLPGDVLDMLGVLERGLTLGQIQQYLPEYRELSELSATMAKLVKQDAVSVVLVERMAGKGRRMVKCYQLTGSHLSP